MDARGQFLQLLALGGGTIAVTTFVHALFVSTAGVALRMLGGQVWGPARFLRDAFTLVLFSLWMMAAHAIAIAIWAELFLKLRLFETFEVAAYFAAISYTTIGFGDVVLEPRWGLLPALAGANGLLSFGLSAALLLDACLKLRLNQKVG
jgi:hypothetical protein